MIVNLIKQKQMFSVTLPHKVKGQYWISDIDEKDKPQELISIEAIHGEWIVKSNKKAVILDAKGNVVENTVLQPLSFFNLRIDNSQERVILFAEPVETSRQTFRKVVVRGPASFTIGRTPENHLCFENRFVSGRHAKLSYDGNGWSIVDSGSTNGTYVNGFRVASQNLFAGDFIYIMGLKIVIGHNFLAVNNPDGLLRILSPDLAGYLPQRVQLSEKMPELPEPQYFYRSPRFKREIEEVEIKIDPPPQAQKPETVPLALMLGPSLTMGLASLSTGILSLSNVLNSGGDIMQAAPTLAMSMSMMLGTVLWPILTRRHEKKMRIQGEKKRQARYLAYLDGIRDEIRWKCKEQGEILQTNFPTPQECADRITQELPNLWERSAGQNDFLRLRVGVGTVPLHAQVSFPEKRFSMEDDTLQEAMLSLGFEPKMLQDVPVSVSLVDDRYIGVVGEHSGCVNMAKMMILQMMSLHSYDELKLMLICDDEKEWNFVKWVPHFWNDDRTMRFFAANADELKELSAYMERNILVRPDSGNTGYTEMPPYYVVISTCRELSDKCEAFQQMLKYKNNRGFSVMILADELKDLPKETKSVVFVNGADSRLFDRDDTTGKQMAFTPDRVNEATVEQLSERIANIHLDLGSQRYTLPSMLTFLEMFGVGKIEHLNSLTRWKENNPTITLQTPIGVDTAGDPFLLDLHEKFHGPHGLVAGMTGSGKSEFIITYILSLAVNYHPNEVAFILIDYKGGGLAGAFEDPDRGIRLPHLAGTITNLDGAAVNRSLISIQSELRRRQAIFNEARKVSNEGTMDIYKYQQLYRDRVVSQPVPHLFIISDEFAELKSQQPEFMEQLISAARIGRSLGVHLILATQKPSGVVDDQIWSNSKFRVCLKVQEKADSQDMIKCSDAAELSQTGRFYLQVGFNELFALGQSAWCGAEYLPTDTLEKTVDSSIQIVDNLGRVMMNVKPARKKSSSGGKIKQVVAIVKYLSDLAAEEKIAQRPLWLPPIPAFIYLEELEAKYGISDRGTVLCPVVGEYDDPFNQKQGALYLPISQEGNCLIYGSSGNGKTTFLTTLAYSLLKNHTARELNLYILDFGSETLKVFEKAPQVGDVILSSDEEKMRNLFKMLYRSMEQRKSLFSEYGGDYAAYCRMTGKVIPNIVVLLNNYSGFAEQFEELTENLTLLSRDGVKYGIYFVVTASSINAMRYRTSQNFRQVLTMQLNDPMDYPVLMGKTEGLVPSRYKGRGLVALDRVYEFQTAYCRKTEDQQEFLRSFCQSLSRSGGEFAPRVPVLPTTVTAEFVRGSVDGLQSLPIGVSKKSLDIMCVDLQKVMIYQAAAQDLGQMIPFLEELVKLAVLSQIPVQVVDGEQLLTEEACAGAEYQTDELEAFVQKLFFEMVARNNDYKDANLDLSILEKYERRLIVIVGMKPLMDRLTDDGKEKLSVLLEKGEAIYKLHFLIADGQRAFSNFTYEAWYKKHLTGTDGIWIGDGMADQYLLKASKITSDLYEEIGDEYGYLLTRGRPMLVKLLSSERGEE